MMLCSTNLPSQIHIHIHIQRCGFLQGHVPHSIGRSLVLQTCRSNGSEKGNKIEELNAEAGSISSSSTSPAVEAVEIRFRRGSRRRRKQEEDDGFGDKKAAKKDWESMSLGEKAIELYVGEKGLLFWLNKFAYASIFIIIGGWILFRFVGPALNLYQLDTPPLSPTAVFKD